ncbi:hypothetical protein [Campylobacter canadensis]|nr:hypothetical protein [Campylobacter canadensis]
MQDEQQNIFPKIENNLSEDEIKIRQRLRLLEKEFGSLEIK